MPVAVEGGTEPVVLDPAGLDALIQALRQRGFRVIGPTVADDAVVYGDIAGTADLPAGIGDEQSGGHYRLTRRPDGALFGYRVAPQGWKRFLFPPRQKLFGTRRVGAGFELEAPPPPEPALAFLGPRACELAAIAVQARVFGPEGGDDPGYQRRLAGAVVIAVECGEAGGTCFCASMDSGPEVTVGFDIKLVELIAKGRHVFLATAATDRGADLLDAVGSKPAEAADRAAAARHLAHAAKTMGRAMHAGTARQLAEFTEHPRWDEVASRCLTCGNCTMVCPTCFCSTVEDVTDLKGDHAERWRRWDSCFTVDFSYIHGGAVRTEARSRYRQWITHKLSNWHQQFGQSGCVGCGRCITWCPVGIDITEEVQAIKSSQKGK